MKNLKWVFDPLPPSGEEQGGDLAKKAFELTINTFVREVIQNSKDANNNKHLEGKPAEVEFTFIELKGDKVKNFLNAIKWKNLSAHLKQGAIVDYSFMIDEIQKLEKSNALRLLLIEDRNTTGLYGKDFQEETPFKSLIKDKLKSSKSNESSGGSHGLGKTVLWGFSAFSSVLFYSNIHEKLRGDLEQHRFIGRTAIPSHKIDGDRGYSGSGWFGDKVNAADSNDSYASSLFGSQAKEAAERAFLNRETEKTGTSILLLGFREPMVEERKTERLLTDLKYSAAEWFWPTMVKKDPDLKVFTRLVRDGDVIESDQVDPMLYDDLKPLIQAYQDYLNENTVNDFETGQETVLKNLTIELPGKKDNTHGPTKGEVKLLVRLADEDAKRTNQVARFRGQGMVIDYLRTGELALDAQKYHAVLVAGLLAGDTSEDEYVDHFLRLSEPPEHVEWTSTEKLRNNYHTPYLQPLQKLKDDIKDSIRALVTKDSAIGDGITPELQKRFRLGSGLGGFVKEADFLIDANAFIRNDRWEFSVEAKSKAPIDGEWKVKIFPRMAEEDASFSKGDTSLIKSIEAYSGGKKIKNIEKSNGYFLINVPDNYEKVNIRGVTEKSQFPIDIELGSLELKIECEK